MTFLSMDVLLWLCGAAIVSLIVPGRFSAAAVAVVTAAFLGVHAPLSFSILLGSTVATWFLAGRHARTPFVIAGVCVAAALLIWFKLEATLIQDRSWISEAGIPLGLSYYSFRQIHYLFERLKQKTPPHGFLDYFCYLFFLPTLMVGPINLFGDFQRDCARRRFDTEMISGGLERILYGCFKIVVLGNYVVSFLMEKAIFEMRLGSPAMAEYLDCFRHAMNLYFQFSGYSDIAIGFSLIMGYRIIENFHYPFLARNISDFWNRWHISLSAFCRNYVFTPVASATRAPYFAVVVSMLVLALWHEITWRYLIWGLWHGGGIAIWQLFQRYKHRMPSFEGAVARGGVRLFSTILTLHFVAVSFIFTKEENLSQSLSALARLLGLEG